MYQEIEKINEIKKYNNELKEKLISLLPYSETRWIGYPAGRFEAKVYFQKSKGDDVFWWYGGISNNSELALNLFGHGEPGSNDGLHIDVQCNFPMLNFNRTTGGAFIINNQSQKIILAHRGIVTIGKSRVYKKELFEEIEATLRKVKTNSRYIDLILISELNSNSLLNDINEFAKEIRRAAKKIGGAFVSKKIVSSVNISPYYDEYSGKRKVKMKSEMIADCYHGNVVRHLRDYFNDIGKHYKNREIDLIIEGNSKIFLFEVKTSSNSQSLYTG
ncbi:MAG TPA: hypothetical protein PKX55_20715, partial [Leptospiraceae bacterium]|nr:hypothetical protein [Leptospiraceae bacterium]